MPVHVIAFGSGCLVGAFVVSVAWSGVARRWKELALDALDEATQLVEVNAELRCEVLGHIFRPVTPEESDAVMAEWLSQYDPRWHE